MSINIKIFKFKQAEYNVRFLKSYVMPRWDITYDFNVGSILEKLSFAKI